MAKSEDNKSTERIIKYNTRQRKTEELKKSEMKKQHSDNDSENEDMGDMNKKNSKNYFTLCFHLNI